MKTNLHLFLCTGHVQGRSKGRASDNVSIDTSDVEKIWTSLNPYAFGCALYHDLATKGFYRFIQSHNCINFCARIYSEQIWGHPLKDVVDAMFEWRSALILSDFSRSVSRELDASEAVDFWWHSTRLFAECKSACWQGFRLMDLTLQRIHGTVNLESCRLMLLGKKVPKS